MDGQLSELLQFLHDRNPQVRQIALSNLLGHTPKDSPYRDVFFTGVQRGSGLQKPAENSCIRDLKLLCRDQLATAHDAFRALVNLSDNQLLADSLAEPSFLGFIVSYIIYSESILADLASMLLSNTSTELSTCKKLAELKVPVIRLPPGSSAAFYPTLSRAGSSPPPAPYPSGTAEDVLALPLLVQAFVQGAKIDASSAVPTRKGELHFLASVFANMSTASPGRSFFLTPRSTDVLSSNLDGELECPLAQLLVFTEHVNTIRRGGVASTIKNCAFHVPAHEAMLTSDTESVRSTLTSTSAPGINVLPYVLLPLAGPEEFDLDDQERLHVSLQFLPETKKREADNVLRLTHVETLLLLCSTFAGRECLRKNGTYEIVRTLHKTEQNDRVAEAVERLVNMLQRNEAPGQNHDWSHDNLGTDIGETSAGNDPIVGAAPPVGPLDDDDDDNRIEEV